MDGLEWRSEIPLHCVDVMRLSLHCDAHVDTALLFTIVTVSLTRTAGGFRLWTKNWRHPRDGPRRAYPVRRDTTSPDRVIEKVVSRSSADACRQRFSAGSRGKSARCVENETKSPKKPVAR